MPYAMLFPLYQAASLNTAKNIIFIDVFTALKLLGFSLLMKQFNFQSPITFFLINSIPMTKQERIQYTFTLADSFTDNMTHFFCF